MIYSFVCCEVSCDERRMIIRLWWVWLNKTWHGSVDLRRCERMGDKWFRLVGEWIKKWSLEYIEYEVWSETCVREEKRGREIAFWALIMWEEMWQWEMGLCCCVCLSLQSMALNLGRKEVNYGPNYLPLTSISNYSLSTSFSSPHCPLLHLSTFYNSFFFITYSFLTFHIKK